MVDPAVYYKESNPALDEGLRYDIFLKEENGTNYQGVVWAGPSYFPDWFEPDSQQYWDEQFIDFFDGTNGPDIDALWIDMNEVRMNARETGTCEDIILTSDASPQTFTTVLTPATTPRPRRSLKPTMTLPRHLPLETALMLLFPASLLACSPTSPLARRASVQLPWSSAPLTKAVVAVELVAGTLENVNGARVVLVRPVDAGRTLPSQDLAVAQMSARASLTASSFARPT